MICLTGIGDVWGIGRRLSERLKAHGLNTALDFAQLPKEIIRDRYNINLERVWRELNGEACIGIEESIDGPQKSLTGAEYRGKCRFCLFAQYGCVVGGFRYTMLCYVGVV